MQHDDDDSVCAAADGAKGSPLSIVLVLTFGLVSHSILAGIVRLQSGQKQRWQHGHAPLPPRAVLKLPHVGPPYPRLPQVLGIEDDNAAYGVFVALMAHKFFAGFSLGSTAIHTRMSLTAKVFIFSLFSLSASIGVGIGMALSSASGTAQSVLQALASGVFLYMGSWHLLTHTLNEGAPHRRLNMLAYLFGVALMGMLALWA